MTRSWTFEPVEVRTLDFMFTSQFPSSNTKIHKGINPIHLATRYI